MHVIGTAGHVDHGKSTLIEALTGVHPDRLKEEREREMTIDLGFAWLTLPGGEEVGIVDVPGHRDFIENMLAGVGGIDAALFVVAADEGVMPQTREHLAILDLLEIEGGVVALTKTDLVDDPEWLDLIEDELRSTLQGTVLEAAPIQRVSARRRQGLSELLIALENCLAGKPPRPDLNRPRLPVDRIFTIAGFGTVVTGTLIDGSLQIGDELEILPSGLRGRVRGLQTHKRKEEIALPGSRTAVNISGVNKEQVQRGDVIARPGSLAPTRRLDVRFRMLPDAALPLSHNAQIKLHIWTSEVMGRVRLLGKETLQPGETGWLQLELASPVTAVRGDHYILRRPSPGETIGGGMVLDPHPKGRHKRFAAETVSRLEALAQGTPLEILQQALLTLGAVAVKDLIRRASLEEAAANQALSELIQHELAILPESRLWTQENPPTQSAVPPNAALRPQPNELIISKTQWEQLVQRAMKGIADYHQANPLRRGMPREELKSRLSHSLHSLTSDSDIQPMRLFNTLVKALVQQKKLQEIEPSGPSRPLLSQAGWTIQFSSGQQAHMDALLKRFAASPYLPPTVKECQAEIGEDLFQAALDLGLLVAVSSEVVFRRQDLEAMKSEIIQLIKTRGSLTAAEARDHFKTSRRYALALLEHLDAAGVTVRDGDYRRLKQVS